ncbi:MAG: glycosyltransferase family 2 protein [Thaumarchaeota archaeon]|nr:glycosyltransferase family 2 protein [Nitrososphaerota archaeon]MCL5317483.1 glycosyltransferase family 2 protein [Nitrososphaerota archaeon]
MSVSPRNTIIAIIPVYAEYTIGKVIKQFKDGLVDEICVVLDSPDPDIADMVINAETTTPIKIIKNKQRSGIGAAIRQGFEYALTKGFSIVVVMAGNGKDTPLEIPVLLNPIVNDGYDYVQGSRYLPGGRPVNTPIVRRIFIRLFPVVWRLSTGFKCTDVTNGFRAYKIRLITDSRVNIRQNWLCGYALEYYIHYKAITLKYKVTEVPVSKVYHSRTNYSKISPLKHWWQILGPLITLRLGIHK